MIPRARDLFGEVPVTLDELADWMRAVPRIEPDSPRFWPYVEGWRVLEKIRAEKLEAEAAAGRRARGVLRRLASRS